MTGEFQFDFWDNPLRYLVGSLDEGSLCQKAVQQRWYLACVVTCRRIRSRDPSVVAIQGCWLLTVVRFGILVVAAFISQELEPWYFSGAAAGNRPICDPNICCCYCCCSFYCCFCCCSCYAVRTLGSRPSFNARCFLLHCAKSVLIWIFDGVTLNQFFQPLSVFV